jgi:hypothetical protein
VVFEPAVIFVILIFIFLLFFFFLLLFFFFHRRIFLLLLFLLLLFFLLILVFLNLFENPPEKIASSLHTRSPNELAGRVQSEREQGLGWRQERVLEDVGVQGKEESGVERVLQQDTGHDHIPFRQRRLEREAEVEGRDHAEQTRVRELPVGRTLAATARERQLLLMSVLGRRRDGEHLNHNPPLSGSTQPTHHLALEPKAWLDEGSGRPRGRRERGLGDRGSQGDDSGGRDVGRVHLAEDGLVWLVSRRRRRRRRRSGKETFLTFFRAQIDHTAMIFHGLDHTIDVAQGQGDVGEGGQQGDSKAVGGDPVLLEEGNQALLRLVLFLLVAIGSLDDRNRQKLANFEDGD